MKEQEEQEWRAFEKETGFTVRELSQKEVSELESIEAEEDSRVIEITADGTEQPIYIEITPQPNEYKCKKYLLTFNNLQYDRDKLIDLLGYLNDWWGVTWCHNIESHDVFGVEYYEDGAHHTLSKHHYRCNKCKGIVQIG